METTVFDVAAAAVAGNVAVPFPFVTVVVAAAAVWLGYAVISRGLFLVTDPVRHSLLDLSEVLCAEPAFPDGDKHLVELALDRVYSNRAAWQMVSRSALIAIRLATGTIKRPGKVEYPSVYARTYMAFQVRWTVAVLGNSPAATLLFGALLMIIAAFTLSATALARLLMGKNGGGHNGTAIAH